MGTLLDNAEYPVAISFHWTDIYDKKNGKKKHEIKHNTIINDWNDFNMRDPFDFQITQWTSITLRKTSTES